MKWQLNCIALSFLILFFPSHSDAELTISNGQWGHFFIDGGVLVLKPQENGLSYGLLTRGKRLLEGNQTNEGTFRYDSSVKTIDFDWDTGFRVKLGYQPLCSHYQLAVAWQRFCTDSSDHTTANIKNGNGELFNGTWSAYMTSFVDIFGENRGGISTLDTFAKAKWDLDVNVVDFLFQIDTCLNPCLLLKPFIGVRIAYIDQDLKLRNTYEGFRGFDLFEDIGLVKEKIKLQNDFHGYGLVGGLGSEFHLGCGFFVHGLGSISLLRGCFKVKERYINQVNIDFFEDDILEDQTDHTTKDLLNDHLYLIRAIADLELGLKWKYCSCDKGATFWLGINWEGHLYFDQNQLCPFRLSQKQDDFSGGTFSFKFFTTDQTNRGDLGLTGWRFAAGINY